MAIRDAWAETDDEVTGEYEINNSSPIPEGTVCRATIEAIEWHSYAGSTHKNPNMTWVIDAPEEYAGRKIFLTTKVNGDDPDSQYFKADKQKDIMESAVKTLRNIDKNAGGFVYALRREPTDAELKKYLIGATMLLTLGINSFTKKNLVRKVSAAPDAPVPKPKAASKTVDSDDIPF